MNDIFLDMQSKMGVAYISDLPYHKHHIFMRMKRMDLSIYPQKQLEDFSSYVFKTSFEQLKQSLEKGAIEWK